MNNRITPTFQPVLFAVIFLTLLSGGASVWLASQKALSPEQTRVFQTCENTWNLGISVIFGLLCSKAATSLLQSGEEKNEK